MRFRTIGSYFGRHLGFWPPHDLHVGGPDKKINVWLLPTTVPNYMLVE